MKKRIKSFIKKIVFSIIKPPLGSAEVIYTSYAQAGEDVVMKFLFDQVQIQNFTYLEIGVYYPDYCNNTFLFYKQGAKGVCVEADETLIPAIKTVRERDTVLNIGVGIKNEKQADFYIFDEKGLNTFSKEEAEHRANLGKYKIVKIAKVPLKTINEIISENFPTYPHLLSIDIEGLDLAVLKTLHFERFPIPVICVETCTYSENHIKPKDKSIEVYMESAGYFAYADTYINTIFVNRKWFERPVDL